MNQLIALMSVPLLAVVASGWAAEPTREEEKAISEIGKMGGRGAFDPHDPKRSMFWVDFEGRKVADVDMVHLKRILEALKNRYLLILDGTEITDAGLMNLNGLKGLAGLTLGRTKVTDGGLQDLEAWPHLWCLGLSGTKVTDEGMKSLEKLNELKELELGNTGVTDVGLKRLSRLSELRRLGLQGTKITDDGLRES